MIVEIGTRSVSPLIIDFQYFFSILHLLCCENARLFKVHLLFYDGLTHYIGRIRVLAIIVREILCSVFGI